MDGQTAGRPRDEGEPPRKAFIVTSPSSAPSPASLPAGPAGSNPSESAAAVKALLVTDLVESTALVRRLGDARGAEIFARHDRLARDLLVTFHGLEIDKTDGFLLLFDRPVDAVSYALAYHAALDRLSEELGVPLTARAGIHLGEVVQRRNEPEDVIRGAKPLEIEGLAKPMAARVMSLAGGRQTLLTRAAFDLARRAFVGRGEERRDLRWLAHGLYRFQGVEEPEEIFEVGVEGQSLLLVPPDTAKARRAVAEGEEITLGWRPAADLEVPRRDHWRLQQRLGEGAFGEVWLAEHTKTAEKRVFKFCHRAEQLHALRREVTVFRLLKEVLGSRDDIARILDWNFDEAPYFLESEYTEGGSLLDWARRQGGIESVPLATRLELVAQVAEALAAAHSVGVLHKDVKPANVLITTAVDGRPRARLTDFGVGLITDREILAARGITAVGWTREGDLESDKSRGGTPIYMAPELLSGGAATVQADVYALGVFLYQMIAGDLRRPLAPGWRRSVADEVLAEDVARAVDGSPDRRTATALEVAEGLRSLEERRRRRQEEARALAREQRAERRRRIFAWAGALGGVFLVVVILLALQAMDARREAERRRAQAEDLVGFMLGDLWDRLEPRASLAVMEGLGDKAIEYLESLPADELTDPERLRWASAFRKMGEVRVSQGDLPEAMELLRRSQGLYEALVARHPERQAWIQELAACRFWVGQVLRKQGRSEGALEEFRAYQELARRLVSLAPEDDEWQLELAYAAANVGTVLRELGRPGEAMKEHENSLAMKRRLLSERPEDVELIFTLAISLNALGALEEDRGSLRGALARFEEELELLQGLAEGDPGNARWIRSLAASENDVGRVRFLLGDLSRALEVLEASRRRVEALVEQDPQNRTWRNALAMNLLDLGTLRLSEDLGAARRNLRQSARILEELVQADPSNAQWQAALARCKTAQARLREAEGDRLGALALAEDSVQRLGRLATGRSTVASGHQWLARALVVQGRLLEAGGDAEGARQSWQRAVALLEPLMEDSRAALDLDSLARALGHLGRLTEAEEIVRELREQGYRGFEAWPLEARAPQRSIL